MKSLLRRIILLLLTGAILPIPAFSDFHISPIRALCLTDQAVPPESEFSHHVLAGHQSPEFCHILSPVVAMQATNRQWSQLLAMLRAMEMTRQSIALSRSSGLRQRLLMRWNREKEDFLSAAQKLIPDGEDDWLVHLADDILSWFLQGDGKTRLRDLQGQGPKTYLPTMMAALDPTKYHPHLQHRTILNPAISYFLAGIADTLPTPLFIKPTRVQREFFQTAFFQDVLVFTMLTVVFELTDFKLFYLPSEVTLRCGMITAAKAHHGNYDRAALLNGQMVAMKGAREKQVSRRAAKSDPLKHFYETFRIDHKTVHGDGELARFLQRPNWSLFRIYAFWDAVEALPTELREDIFRHAVPAFVPLGQGEDIKIASFYPAIEEAARQVTGAPNPWRRLHEARYLQQRMPDIEPKIGRQSLVSLGRDRYSAFFRGGEEDPYEFYRGFTDAMREHLNRLWTEIKATSAEDALVHIGLVGAGFGQQPLSIALVLERLLDELSIDRRRLDYRLHVFDYPDFVQAMLSARRLIYPDESLHDVSEDEKERYFDKMPSGWQPKEGWYGHFDFRPINLLADSLPEAADLAGQLQFFVMHNVLFYLKPGDSSMRDEYLRLLRRSEEWIRHLLSPQALVSLFDEATLPSVPREAFRFLLTDPADPVFVNAALYAARTLLVWGPAPQNPWRIHTAA